MNCVGIDVSKGKSMIAVMRPFGEVVVSPFEVRHTASELSELARLLKNLDGETRVVMESTGNYLAAPRRGVLCLRSQCNAGARLREQQFKTGQDRQEGCREAGQLRP